jgi:hypothetical protein
MNKDLKDLSIIQELINRDSPFTNIIETIYNETKEILNTRIQRIFPNYTLHNIAHSLRIIKYMGNIVADISKLSDLELCLLSLSAILHDVGMAVSEEQIENIKKDELTINGLKYSAMLKLVGNDESLALQEYVRRVHSQLSRIYITENLKERFTIPSMSSLSYNFELGLICQSHTESYDWILDNLNEKEIRGDYHFNARFISSILRLGDILDIDSNRTPYNLYKLVNPTGLGEEEWQQHFIISNNDKIDLNQQTNQKFIILHGKSHNPKIHRKLLKYISWIDYELNMSIDISSKMQDQYVLNYEKNVRTNIQTDGFTFSDYRMQLDYKAISNLLMGEKIYGSKEYGLRELIQNCYDACILKREINSTNAEFGEEIIQPKIKVITSKSENLVLIKDNGIGMSLEVIKDHFLNVGISYYKSTDFKLRDFNYKPIGNYGIGFLACFMLSDNVTVTTRHYKSRYKYLIELEKGDEWTSLDKIEDLVFQGTEIKLNYSTFESAFDKGDYYTRDTRDLNQKIKDYLTKYFLTDEVELNYIDRDKEEITKIENSIHNIEAKKGEVKINLSEYIKGIEGYVIIKKNEKFFTTLNDLDYKFSGETYIYTDDGLVDLDSNKFELHDYIDENRINFLKIPIITKSLEDKYVSGMEFTEEDLDEVLERLEHDLEYVTVLFKKELQYDLDYGEISPGSNIIRDFGFDDLENIGQSDECSTKSTLEHFDIYKGVNNKIYMPFSENISSHAWGDRVKNDELFIRNVLIDDFRFSFERCATIFSLSRAKINIKNQNFIPDISRNNLSEESSTTINYLISKIMHVAAYENFNLEDLEKLSLKKFIDEHFAITTEYEKSR